METSKPELHPEHQTFLDRFVAACKLNADIVAAFLGGSYARGTADRYSDIDVYVIVSDDAFDDFNTNRDEFLRLLGEPLFIENFDIPNIVFFIYADGVEGELGIGSESKYTDIHAGPHILLVDKKNILSGVEFAPAELDPLERAEQLRRLIYWFWHDLSHFITAMQRGQLWWAQGQLEALRRYCVNLLRMRHNFSDLEAGDEPYFKIDQTVPVGQLSVLEETFCLREKAAMLKSGVILVKIYKELATSLARAHDIPYPEALERIMVQRLEDLQSSTS
jgi:predicted nucleotidyltransferase